MVLVPAGHHPSVLAGLFYCTQPVKALILTMTLALVLAATDATAHSTPEWQAQSAATRAALARMDKLINSAAREKAYVDYLAMFHPRVQAWGLYPDGAADLGRIREHYRPVFFELGGGVLVSDQVIVAGPMAAQRYHSLMVLNGTFDGVEANNKPVVIRGQTFFMIDQAGVIRERWSNHDHAYRMAQLRGEKGAQEGRELAGKLNGPGLSEESGIDALALLVAAFNQPEDPARRESRVAALLAPGLRVHGLDGEVKDSRAMQAFLGELWQAYPDLILMTGPPVSGWSMVAARWRASGSQRAPFRNQFGGRVPVSMHGELILRFTAGGLVEEAWIDARTHCRDGEPEACGIGPARLQSGPEQNRTDSIP